MRSTNVYIIAFMVGAAIAISLVFAASLNTLVGWITVACFWILLFVGLVWFLLRILPGADKSEPDDLSPPHPLIADVIDPEKYPRRQY